MIENLYRSRTDKVIGGVAGGLAERIGLPSLVVRALIVFSCLFLHFLPLIYLVLWVVVPEDEGRSEEDVVNVVVNEVVEKAEEVKEEVKEAVKEEAVDEAKADSPAEQA